MSRFLWSVCLSVLPAVALAQGPPEPAWATGATTVKNELVAILSQVFPIMAGLLAILLGVGLFVRLVRGFAK